MNNKWIDKTKFKWIIFLISTIAFVGIVTELVENDLAKFDNFVYDIVSVFISNTMTTIFKVITNLGGTWVLILLTMSVLIGIKNRKYGFFMTLNLVIVFILNLSLKNFFSRPRPIDINLITEWGYSFPSGHSMISAAFYGYIIFLIKNSELEKRKKWILSIILFVLVILIGLSRIYLGVHFASDVLGGFLIATSYLILYTYIIKRYLYK